MYKKWSLPETETTKILVMNEWVGNLERWFLFNDENPWKRRSSKEKATV